MLTIAKIEHVGELCKLFGFNVPRREDFDYYMRTLAKSAEFTWSLPSLLTDFAGYERWLAGRGLTPARYKESVVEQLCDSLRSLHAWQRFTEQPMPEGKLPAHDTSAHHTGRTLVSVDLVSAAYNILKSFDEEGALPPTWAGLCAGREVHPVLARSKPFRQLVLGQLEPRRNQTLQAQHMDRWRGYFEAHQAGSIVALYHDEIVLDVGSDTEQECLPALRQLRQLVDEAPLSPRLPLDLEVYRLERVGKGYRKTVCDVTDAGLTQRYRTLTRVPGNQFYLYFKEFILEEPFDDRDLYFQHDGRLARWVV